jgi:hypothetical protein
MKAGSSVGTRERLVGVLSQAQMRCLPQPLPPCRLAFARPIEPPLRRPANFTGVLQLRDAGAGAVFVLLTVRR